MGCGSSKQIELETKKQDKLLLLGAGETGKSTFIRQLKILYEGGYSTEEVTTYRDLVHQMILQCASQLHEAYLSLKLESSDSKLHNKLLEYVAGSFLEGISDESITLISSMWSDPILRSIYEDPKLRSQVQLNDTTPYFLNDLSRFTAPEYMPTVKDIIHIRVRTTGIFESIVSKGSSSFLVTDVGGQRSERKKWMHCFENVDSVIFFISLSEFDQLLFETGDMPRYKESFNLFKDICTSHWFTESNIILLFSKEDIFKTKLDSGSDLTAYFDDYDGPKNDFDASYSQVKNYFLSAAPESRRSQIATIKLNVTDSTAVDKVFTQIADITTNKSSSSTTSPSSSPSTNSPVSSVSSPKPLI